jgi:hypothetical protein
LTLAIEIAKKKRQQGVIVTIKSSTREKQEETRAIKEQLKQKDKKR